jgi:hypothetical protein
VSAPHAWSLGDMTSLRSGEAFLAGSTHDLEGAVWRSEDEGGQWERSTDPGLAKLQQGYGLEAGPTGLVLLGAERRPEPNKPWGGVPALWGPRTRRPGPVGFPGRRPLGSDATPRRTLGRLVGDHPDEGSLVRLRHEWRRSGSPPRRVDGDASLRHRRCQLSFQVSREAADSSQPRGPREAPVLGPRYHATKLTSTRSGTRRNWPSL